MIARVLLSPKAVSIETQDRNLDWLTKDRGGAGMLTARSAKSMCVGSSPIPHSNGIYLPLQKDI